MDTLEQRKTEEQVRITAHVSVIRTLILNDAGVQAEPEREMSILSRALCRYAEGTLGDDVAISESPAWLEAVLPALKQLAEQDRVVVATGVALDLFNCLYTIRLQKLVSSLMTEAA